MNQVAWLPPSYDELIPANHLVRVVMDQWWKQAGLSEEPDEAGD